MPGNACAYVCIHVYMCLRACVWASLCTCMSVLGGLCSTVANGRTVMHYLSTFCSDRVLC